MIDPTATEPIEVRCVCPGTPHDKDTIAVRSQYGYGDSLALSKASVKYQIGVHPKDKTPLVLPYTDAFSQHEALLELAVKEWSLVDHEGKPLPVALSSILLLPEDIGELIATKVNEFYEASKASVPNASGEPSQDSTPESSPTPPNRATRRSRKPSTRS
jgi:hypothetical protein